MPYEEWGSNHLQSTVMSEDSACLGGVQQDGAGVTQSVPSCPPVCAYVGSLTTPIYD